MTDYQSLGIRPIINANATLTRLGGSLLPPEVITAMNEAARSFIDLNELQRRVGERLAELTHNEAAYVSSGAAGGLALATAACVTGCDPHLIYRFPDLSGLKNEIIIHRTHRNHYDYAVQSVGVKIVEYGYATGTTRVDLERVITPQTAGIFWFQGVMTGNGDLPLADVIAIANAYDIPVVVDAAAQLPPVENLWRFTEMGAALAIFSGGKDLRGPQASGLMLGRHDLIEAARMHGAPNHALGRPMKVTKESMMGLLAAVERYLRLDHTARAQYCEDTVAAWNTALNAVPGVTAIRDFPNEAGQPLPWSLVTFDTAQLDLDAEAIRQALLDGDPAVDVAPVSSHQLHLNPMTLEPGEEKIVLERLLAVLHR